jgi:hypothetical protein
MQNIFATFSGISPAFVFNTILNCNYDYLSARSGNFYVTE